MDRQKGVRTKSGRCHYCSTPIEHTNLVVSFTQIESGRDRQKDRQKEAGTAERKDKQKESQKDKTWVLPLLQYSRRTHKCDGPTRTEGQQVGGTDRRTEGGSDRKSERTKKGQTGQTDLEAAFIAVLPQNTQIGWLHADPVVRRQVAVFQRRQLQTHQQFILNNRLLMADRWWVI